MYVLSCTRCEYLAPYWIYSEYFSSTSPLARHCHCMFQFVCVCSSLALYLYFVVNVRGGVSECNVEEDLLETKSKKFVVMAKMAKAKHTNTHTHIYVYPPHIQNKITNSRDRELVNENRSTHKNDTGNRVGNRKWCKWINGNGAAPKNLRNHSIKIYPPISLYMAGNPGQIVIRYRISKIIIWKPETVM